MSELSLGDSDPVTLEELKAELASLDRRCQYLASWILGMQLAKPETPPETSYED